MYLTEIYQCGKKVILLNLFAVFSATALDNTFWDYGITLSKYVTYQVLQKISNIISLPYLKGGVLLSRSLFVNKFTEKLLFRSS